MVMENGFSSPSRSEAFPAGLRVLVVDDDPTWLKILERMLKKCSYEVTTCGLASEALRLLRDRKDGFDIVMSDVNMPDMDGFKLLEHVGLEMDLPVIMMSVDGETSRVMKGVQHGACDYFLKPIRMKELKNIWQHVVRKRLHEVRDIECIDDRIGTEHFHDGYLGSDQTFLKKRKDVDNKHDDKDSSDPLATKKARVVWTVDLHKKFVEAVNQLGIDSDKIGPKKILDLMNVSWLTRENVASHLQKYRLFLNRLRKEDNMEVSYGGMKNPDHPLKESSGGFNLQISSFGKPKDISSKYVYQENHGVESKPLNTNAESSNRAPFSTVSHNASNPLLGLDHTFGSLDMSVDHTSFESPVWSGEFPGIQFEPGFKPPLKLENSLNQPAVPVLQQEISLDILNISPDVLEPTTHIGPNVLDPAPQIGPNVLELAPQIGAEPPPQIGPNVLEPVAQIGAHLLEPAPHISPGQSISESNHLDLIDIEPLSAKEGEDFGQGVDSVKQQQPFLESSTHSVPVHSESQVIDAQGLEPSIGVPLETKNQSSFEYELRNQVLGSESASGLLGEDLLFRWIQCADPTSKDLGFDCLGWNFPENDLDSSLPLHVPKLDTEYPFEWMEYPLNHGILFS